MDQKNKNQRWVASNKGRIGPIVMGIVIIIFSTWYGCEKEYVDPNEYVEIKGIKTSYDIYSDGLKSNHKFWHFELEIENGKKFKLQFNELFQKVKRKKLRSKFKEGLQVSVWVKKEDIIIHEGEIKEMVRHSTGVYAYYLDESNQFDFDDLLEYRNDKLGGVLLLYGFGLIMIMPSLLLKDEKKIEQISIGLLTIFGLVGLVIMYFAGWL